MNYCFYIDVEYWRKVVGEEKFSKNQGHVCAHCTLEAVGGIDWQISYREPSEEMKRRRQAATRPCADSALLETAAARYESKP